MKKPDSDKALNKKAQVAQKRREQILQGALVVFAAKGYLGATNRDIANEAGIGSPGLIYHYFKDKKDLLTHVVQRFHPLIDILDNADRLPQNNSAPSLDALRSILESIAITFQQALANEQLLSLVRVIVGENLHDLDFAATFYKAIPLRLIDYLASLFTLYQEQGLVKRDYQPSSLAFQFVGPYFMRALVKCMFGETHQYQAPATVEIFLRGAICDPHSPAIREGDNENN